MKVQFLRVLSWHAHHPVVVARADGKTIRWRPRKGWNCEACYANFCPHITAVETLIDPKVTGKETP